MKSEELKVGDEVDVMDNGLLMLQKFAPPGAKLNNRGKISRIMKDGYVEVEFPIGDDDPKQHSQVAPYPASICKKINQ